MEYIIAFIIGMVVGGVLGWFAYKHFSEEDRYDDYDKDYGGV